MELHTFQHENDKIGSTASSYFVEMPGPDV